MHRREDDEAPFGRRILRRGVDMLSTLSLDVDRDREPAVLTEHGLAAARAFYVDLLQGTLVCAARRHTDHARAWFRVYDGLIETGPGIQEEEPVLLHVEDPLAVAERCWDAGFSVRMLEQPCGDATVAVTDPFGRQIELVECARGNRSAGASGA
jgi:hypothetical protein